MATFPWDLQAARSVLPSPRTVDVATARRLTNSQAGDGLEGVGAKLSAARLHMTLLVLSQLAAAALTLTD